MKISLGLLPSVLVAVALIPGLASAQTVNDFSNFSESGNLLTGTNTREQSFTPGVSPAGSVMDGLYPNGSTGEFIRLSYEDRLRVVKQLAMDCPRIIGIKDSSRDFPRFCTMLSQIKPQRPDFVCFSGTEEILYPSLVMGADGGTIASSGVMPEVITKLYRDFLAGNHTECRRVQWMIQDLIATMFAAGNFPEGFPEGFRAAVSLRGFNPGPPRFPMSPGEEASLEEAKGRLACLLADCGYAEVARECELRRKPAASLQSNPQIEVESIVREVVRKMGPDSRTSGI